MTDALSYEEWGVPYFWMEDDRLMRRLNGVTTSGVFVDGRFVETPQDPGDD